MEILFKCIILLVFVYWYKNTKNISVLLMTLFSLIEVLRVVMTNKFINSNIIIVINIVQFVLIVSALIIFIISLKRNNKFK